MQPLLTICLLVCLGGIAVAKRERATQTLSIASGGSIGLNGDAQIANSSNATRSFVKTKGMKAKTRIDPLDILQKLAQAAYEQVGTKQVWIINMDMDTFKRNENWITYHPRDIVLPCPTCRVDEYLAVRAFGLTRQHYLMNSAAFEPSREDYFNALRYGASQKITVTSEAPSQLQIVKGWHYQEPGLVTAKLAAGAKPDPSIPEYACEETRELVTGGPYVYVGGCTIHDISSVLNISGAPGSDSHRNAQEILQKLVCVRPDTSHVEGDPEIDACMSYLSCAVSELFWRSSTRKWGFSYHGETYLYDAWDGYPWALCLQEGDREGLWHYGEYCGQICPVAGPCHGWCGTGGACCKWNSNVGSIMPFGEVYHPACGKKGGAPQSCKFRKCCVPDREQVGWEDLLPSSGLNEEHARSFGEPADDENSDEAAEAVKDYENSDEAAEAIKD